MRCAEEEGGAMCARCVVALDEGTREECSRLSLSKHAFPQESKKNGFENEIPLPSHSFPSQACIQALSSQQHTPSLPSSRPPPLAVVRRRFAPPDDDRAGVTDRRRHLHFAVSPPLAPHPHTRAHPHPLPNVRGDEAAHAQHARVPHQGRHQQVPLQGGGRQGRDVRGRLQSRCVVVAFIAWRARDRCTR